jgi:hypothetical protein
VSLRLGFNGSTSIKASLKLNKKERGEFINNCIFECTLGTGGIHGQFYFNENFLSLFGSSFLNEIGYVFSSLSARRFFIDSQGLIEKILSGLCSL